MRKPLILCLLASVVLQSSGCNSPMTMSPTNMPTIFSKETASSTLPLTVVPETKTPTVTPTHAPTSTWTPSATKTSPTTPISQPIWSLSEGIGYDQNCIIVENAMPPDFLSEGMILIANSQDDRLYGLESHTTNPHPLTTISGYTVRVSPNRKWFAYTKEDANGQEFLEVRNANGQKHWSIPYGENWSGLGEWINNEQIVMSYWLDVDGTPDWRTDSADVIVNVFTGQITKLDFLALDVFSDNGKSTSYDPSLTRMVYKRHTPAEFASLVLWDLQTNQELWRMEIGDYTLHTEPQWSPDGTHFAIGGPPALYNEVFELFIVDRDGQARQVTHFNENGFRQERIYNATWSPDRRYIAFWLVNYQKGIGSLAVYDSTTEIVTDYCIPAGDSLGFSLFWSPGSQQIVLESSVGFNEPSQVIVVDIQESEAIRIIDDTHYWLTGWITAEP